MQAEQVRREAPPEQATRYGRHGLLALPSLTACPAGWPLIGSLRFLLHLHGEQQTVGALGRRLVLRAAYWCPLSSYCVAPVVGLHSPAGPVVGKARGCLTAHPPCLG